MKKGEDFLHLPPLKLYNQLLRLHQVCHGNFTIVEVRV